MFSKKFPNVWFCIYDVSVSNLEYSNPVYAVQIYNNIVYTVIHNIQMETCFGQQPMWLKTSMEYFFL